MQPLVSIIIPTYNNQSTVIETLDSVHKQTYPHIETIVVNDGSTDDTEIVVQAYIRDNPDVHLISQSNSGPSTARNLGFEKSSGTYLVFLDADDLLAPAYVEECIYMFTGEQPLDIVFSETQLFEGQKGLFQLADYSPATIMQQNCFPIFAMIKADIFQSIGMFDPKIGYGEDWEMWIRYTRNHNRIYKIPKILCFYRKRASKDSISDQNAIDNISDDAHLYIYCKHYDIYKSMGWNIINLLSTRNEYLKYKRKYYGEWYRKLIYWIRGKKKIVGS